MALWGKLKSREWDPTEGNPHVRNGLRLLEARNWSGLGELYRGQGPSDRYHFVERLGELSKLDDDLPAQFDSPDATAIVAGIRVGWAWRHRGYGRG